MKFKVHILIVYNMAFYEEYRSFLKISPQFFLSIFTIETNILKQTFEVMFIALNVF